MKIFKSIFLLLFLLFIAYSCKKDGDLPQENPPGNTDTIDKPYGSPFDNVPAIEDIVMYEVNLRAFSTNGNIQGVIDRLDELKNLGINVIWLMPIHPIGEINSVNSPYSVKDYKAVSSEYGSLSDLRKLTDMAHEKDMAVIMDWVANHTSWDNNWIHNKSWYTQDGSGNIVHPPGTNWLDVADLDFSNAEMRLQMIKVMKYWIWEANIDGYRCDYADGVPYSFWNQCLDSLNTFPGRELIFLAEGGRSDHFSAGFDMDYSWDFYNALKNVYNGQSAQQIVIAHQSEYTRIPQGKHKLRYTTNHDESAWDATPMELFNGQEGALAASALGVFIGGCPMIYTGQEVGREETVPFFSNSPINWNDYPDMLAAYQNIMEFYNQSEVARKGINSFFSHADVICLQKTFNDEELLLIVNLRNNPVAFLLPIEFRNSSWTNALDDTVENLDIHLPMNAYQYLILKNNLQKHI